MNLATLNGGAIAGGHVVAAAAVNPSPGTGTNPPVVTPTPGSTTPTPTATVTPAATTLTATDLANIVAALATAPVGSVANLPPSYLAAGAVLAIPAPAPGQFAAQGADLVPLSGAYRPQAIHFETGILKGVRRAIAVHSYSGGVHTFSVDPFPVAPASADAFVIV